MVKAQPKEFATLTSPTQTLADYVSGLSYKKIPQAVISHTKLCIIDALGCALFGSTLPWGKIITSFTKEMGKGKGALIWGDGAEVPSTSAPLANGTLIHSFEMDDLHRVGVIHPGSEAIPAADALVRHLGDVDGKRFLAAVAVGYEVGCRVGMTGGAAQLRRGFHPSATSGTFAAGAAAAKMLRLNAAKTVHALGIAGTQAAGLMAAIWAGRAAPGRRVALLESARRPGAKILVSGGGRCNVTHHRVETADFWAENRFTMTTDFACANYGKLMRDELIVCKPVRVARRGFVALRKGTGPRTQPMLLRPSRYKERAEITLPPGCTVEETIRPVAVRRETF